MDNLDDIDVAEEYREEYDKMRDRIFEILKIRKISQRELAKRLKVTPQTITDWKKGKSYSFRSKISPLSKALDTTPGWLSFGEGPQFVTAEERVAIAERARKELSKWNYVPPTETIQKKPVISKTDMQAAFWGGDKDLSQEEIDAMWEDVERFAQFLAEKKRQEKMNGD